MENKFDWYQIFIYILIIISIVINICWEIIILQPITVCLSTKTLSFKSTTNLTPQDSLVKKAPPINNLSQNPDLWNCNTFRISNKSSITDIPIKFLSKERMDLYHQDPQFGLWGTSKANMISTSVGQQKKIQCSDASVMRIQGRATKWIYILDRICLILSRTHMNKMTFLKKRSLFTRKKVVKQVYKVEDEPNWVI